MQGREVKKILRMRQIVNFTINVRIAQNFYDSVAQSHKQGFHNSLISPIFDGMMVARVMLDKIKKTTYYKDKR